MRNILIILLLFPNLSFSQNLDKIGEKDAIKVSGGLNFNSVAYLENQVAFPSREPFTWFASGNLNVNILDVSLPFTFSYSNQGGKFTQPFNRTAIHPSYKWVKTHIGMISTSFSPYTLSGHLFLGGAVELEPGKWRIQLMAGRLIKPIPYSVVDDNLDEFAYGRFGYGIKVGYRLSKFSAGVTLFKAQDQIQSIPVLPLNSDVSPQNNLVLGADTKIQLIKNLSITAEYALSGLTQNTLDIGPSNGSSSFSFLNSLIAANATTDFFQSAKTSLDYKLKWSSYAFKFEHIDPGYKTLGGYYFNNDLRNFTFAPQFSFFKNRLNVGLNTGFQINNLEGDKTATTKRWVGNVNVSAMPLKGLVLSGNYSNFSTFTRNRPVGDPFYYAPADTMNFYQLTQNAMAMVAYSLNSETKTHAIQVLYNYQESINLSGAISSVNPFGTTSISEGPQPARIHNSNISYTVQLKKLQAGVSVIGNYNASFIQDLRTDFFGPSVNLTKSLLEKSLSLALGSTYNLQFQNGAKSGDVLNHRLNVSYKPKAKSKWKNYTLGLNANLLQRFALDITQPNTTELFVYFNFGYSF